MDWGQRGFSDNLDGRATLYYVLDENESRAYRRGWLEANDLAERVHGREYRNHLEAETAAAI